MKCLILGQWHYQLFQKACMDTLNIVLSIKLNTWWSTHWHPPSPYFNKYVSCYQEGGGNWCNSGTLNNSSAKSSATNCRVWLWQQTHLTLRQISFESNSCVITQTNSHAVSFNNEIIFKYYDNLGNPINNVNNVHHWHEHKPNTLGLQIKFLTCFEKPFLNNFNQFLIFLCLRL